MRTHSIRLSISVAKFFFVSCLLSMIACPAKAAVVNGSDASWYTQMVNNSGYTFYTQAGVQEPCLNVLQSVGIQAIRLRVWLNPTGGWCNQADTVTKALAAHALGQQVYIDFHYSDTWSGNNSETPPAAWSGYNLSQMESAVASETSSVLSAIKSGGGTVSWVSCGNEEDDGLLFPLGGVNGYGDGSWSNLAGIINSGYNAVKSVFPSCPVMVHLDFGGSTSSYTSWINNFRNAGGKIDMVGMSAYPYWDNVSYQTEISYATATMQAIKALGLPSMVSECGYLESDPTDCKSYLTGLIAAANANGCVGVFYWEPECYGNWPVGSNYTLGAFTNGATGYGEPNAGMNAFGGGGGGGGGITSGGTYTLESKYSSQFLDNGSTDTEGARVLQWDSNGGSQQNWTITSNGSYYTLKNGYSGDVLDNDSETGNGAEVVQWPANGGSSQNWTINSEGSGYYELVSEYSGEALDNGSTTTEGAYVEQWAINGGSSQLWYISN